MALCDRNVDCSDEYDEENCGMCCLKKECVAFTLYVWSNNVKTSLQPKTINSFIEMLTWKYGINDMEQCITCVFNEHVYYTLL